MWETIKNKFNLFLRKRKIYKKLNFFVKQTTKLNFLFSNYQEQFSKILNEYNLAHTPYNWKITELGNNLSINLSIHNLIFQIYDGHFPTFQIEINENSKKEFLFTQSKIIASTNMGELFLLDQYDDELMKFIENQILIYDDCLSNLFNHLKIFYPDFELTDEKDIKDSIQNYFHKKNVEFAKKNISNELKKIGLKKHLDSNLPENNITEQIKKNKI